MSKKFDPIKYRKYVKNRLNNKKENDAFLFK